MSGDRAALQAILGECEEWIQYQHGDPGRILEAIAARCRRALDLPPGSPEPVCGLCLFVGDSEDPTPITIMNGNLTCEPHNGYFQGGDHVQAIIAWKREHPE